MYVRKVCLRRHGDVRFAAVQNLLDRDGKDVARTLRPVRFRIDAQTGQTQYRL